MLGEPQVKVVAFVIFLLLSKPVWPLSLLYSSALNPKTFFIVLGLKWTTPVLVTLASCNIVIFSIEPVAEAKKAELGIDDEAKMGMLVGATMKELAGKADGKRIADLVKKSLGA